jgi:hypothetical protein
VPINGENTAKFAIEAATKLGVPSVLLVGILWGGWVITNRLANATAAAMERQSITQHEMSKTYAVLAENQSKMSQNQTIIIESQKAVVHALERLAEIAQRNRLVPLPRQPETP